MTVGQALMSLAEGNQLRVLWRTPPRNVLGHRGRCSSVAFSGSRLLLCTIFTSGAKCDCSQPSGHCCPGFWPLSRPTPQSWTPPRLSLAAPIHFTNNARALKPDSGAKSSSKILGNAPKQLPYCAPQEYKCS